MDYVLKVTSCLRWQWLSPTNVLKTVFRCVIFPDVVVAAVLPTTASRSYLVSCRSTVCTSCGRRSRRHLVKCCWAVRLQQLAESVHHCARWRQRPYAGGTATAPRWIYCCRHQRFCCCSCACCTRREFLAGPRGEGSNDGQGEERPVHRRLLTAALPRRQCAPVWLSALILPPGAQRRRPSSFPASRSTLCRRDASECFDTLDKWHRVPAFWSYVK